MRSDHRARIKGIILALFDVSGRDCLDKAQFGKAYCYANIEALRGVRRPVCLWPVVKMPYGPGIHQYREVLDEMVRDGWLERVGQVMYRRRPDAPSDLGLSEEDRGFLEAAWRRVEGRHFGALRDESHELASYKEAETGEEMLLELDAFGEELQGAPAGAGIPDSTWERWKREGLSR
jgi:hypothetical protein